LDARQDVVRYFSGPVLIMADGEEALYTPMAWRIRMRADVGDIGHVISLPFQPVPRGYCRHRNSPFPVEDTAGVAHW
jgi:hypothetical protein